MHSIQILLKTCSKYHLAIQLVLAICYFAAMAVALGNLYHNKYQIEEHDLAPVLSAASELEFLDLMLFCVAQMEKCICYSNITHFFLAALKVSDVV